MNLTLGQHSTPLGVEPLNTEDKNEALLTPFLSSYTVAMVFRECGQLLPDETKKFKQQHEIWIARNKKEIEFLEDLFSHKAVMEKDEKVEILALANTASSKNMGIEPHDYAACKVILESYNTLKFMDISYKFKNHLEFLRKAFDRP